MSEHGKDENRDCHDSNVFASAMHEDLPSRGMRKNEIENALCFADQGSFTVSPPPREPIACQTRTGIESRTKRTLPSPMQTLTPPTW